MTAYTLTYNGTTITLDGYRWVNRHNYSNVSMAVTETITQAKVLEFFTEDSGRPIDLAPMGDYGHILLADLDTLAVWAQIPGAIMAFGDGTTTRNTVFGRPAITNDTPYRPDGFTREDGQEMWRAEIHLMET